MIDVQNEINLVLEKFNVSFLPTNNNTAKMMENNLNNILLQGISEGTINDTFYFDVIWTGKIFRIDKISESVLVWKNKGTWCEDR